MHQAAACSYLEQVHLTERTQHMGKQTETPVATAKPEAKTEAKPARKMLTPEQRVAKLEADLKAAREKAAAKENKAKAEATEKREKLLVKRDALTKQIDELSAIIGDVELPADETNAA